MEEKDFAGLSVRMDVGRRGGGMREGWEEGRKLLVAVFIFMFMLYLILSYASCFDSLS